MKREIKFRAWHPKFGEMVYSNMDNEYQDKREWYPVCFEIGFSHYPHSIMDDETILMQSTGLKDKNEKEIYEGDILKISTDKPMGVGWSVKFASFVLNRNGWAFSHWFGESCNPEDCEIVGNKYENAELLQDAV